MDIKIKKILQRGYCLLCCPNQLLALIPLINNNAQHMIYEIRKKINESVQGWLLREMYCWWSFNLMKLV